MTTTLHLNTEALEAEKLRDKWVALDQKGEVIAHGKRLGYVIKRAEQKGVKDPLIVQAPLPSEGSTFL
jgi:Family of unknown function (DUF5678)